MVSCGSFWLDIPSVVGGFIPGPVVQESAKVWDDAVVIPGGILK